MRAAVTGGLFRLNLGLRGLAAGTIIGAVLGWVGLLFPRASIHNRWSPQQSSSSAIYSNGSNRSISVLITGLSFLTDMWIRSCSCVCVCACICACVLPSSERSGCQLRPSQQPSVAQLNPRSTPAPHLQLCSRRQRDSCAPQRAMFWVLEQEGRPRQQLPLSIYIISVIPASHLHLPRSDLGLCFTAFHLSSLALSHFSLVPLATFSWVHRARSRFECDCIMEIEREVFDGVTDWRG